MKDNEQHVEPEKNIEMGKLINAFNTKPDTNNKFGEMIKSAEKVSGSLLDKDVLTGR